MMEKGDFRGRGFLEVVALNNGRLPGFGFVEVQLSHTHPFN